MTARVVWFFLSFILWAWAIVGPLGLAIRMFLWASGSDPFGEREAEQLGTAVFVSLVGISFAWLRLTDQLRFGDELPEEDRSSPPA
jgi:hypothetical protein